MKLVFNTINLKLKYYFITLKSLFLKNIKKLLNHIQSFLILFCLIYALLSLFLFTVCRFIYIFEILLDNIISNIGELSNKSILISENFINKKCYTYCKNTPPIFEIKRGLFNNSYDSPILSFHLNLIFQTINENSITINEILADKSFLPSDDIKRGPKS